MYFALVKILFSFNVQLKTLFWSYCVFSGNWNGTESVEEWDFLWGPR